MQLLYIVQRLYSWISLYILWNEEETSRPCGNRLVSHIVLYPRNVQLHIVYEFSTCGAYVTRYLLDLFTILAVGCLLRIKAINARRRIKDDYDSHDGR